MSGLHDSIAQSAPCLQELTEKVKEATTLAMLVLAALQLGRAVVIKVVEEILNERGQAPDEGRECPKCGKQLESKGLKRRGMMTLIGLIQWRRRVRGCPAGCEIGQVVPSDKALGIAPYQQTSREVK